MSSRLAVQAPLQHGNVTRREWLRFLGKVRFTTDGHWVWQAGKDKDGYGKFWWRGQTGRAHRFAYIALRGDIPTGMEPDHLCRIVSCVNPDCIEIVAPAENRERSQSITVLQLKQTHCKRGHLFDEKNTYYAKVHNRHTYGKVSIQRHYRKCTNLRMRGYNAQRRG